MRNKLLRILSIVVVCFVLVFSFVGCKKDSNKESNLPSNTKQEEIQGSDIIQEQPSIDDFDPEQGQQLK